MPGLWATRQGLESREEMGLGMETGPGGLRGRGRSSPVWTERVGGLEQELTKEQGLRKRGRA